MYHVPCIGKSIEIMFQDVFYDWSSLAYIVV